MSGNHTHYHTHHHHSVEARCEVMRRLDAIDVKIDLAKETIMTALDDQLATLTTALSGIGTAVDTMAPEVTKIGTETTATLAALTALQNNPPTGITPAQQATLDAAVTSAQTILASVSNLSTSLKAVDDLVPDAA